MRLIGTIENDKHASLFSDYLFVRGIENSVELEDKGYEVWVLADDQMEEATNLLKEFTANPAAPEYAGVEKAARKKEAQIEEEAAAAADRSFSSRELIHRNQTTPIFATMLLIAISICVAFLSHLGNDSEVLQPWHITQFIKDGNYFQPHGMPEVAHGQVWRLVTPIFIHFGFLHLFFNMYWLVFLGGMIERAKGHFYLLLLVLVSAVLSNTAQYMLPLPGLSDGSPNFGGMSGVVYALFGYCWMKSKYDFASGIVLHPNTVVMMIIWYALCFTGVMHIANMVHTVGLIVGVIWGFTSARRSLTR
jgi:GlpG protein